MPAIAEDRFLCGFGHIFAGGGASLSSLPSLPSHLSLLSPPLSSSLLSRLSLCDAHAFTVPAHQGPRDGNLNCLMNLFKSMFATLSRGYSAGYYSYLWAEVLSADAFGAFEEAGLEDEAAVTSTGARFADTVLALGGGTAPLEVFTAFRGRGPSVEALLRHNGLVPAAA